MKRLRKFFTEIEAEQARSLLAAEGVPAYVEGANTQTMLAYIGPALGGVKLLVDEADAQRAEEILQRSLELPDIPAWTCGNCFSEVDAGFEVCWRCGADYTQAARLDDDESQAGDPGPADYRSPEAEVPPAAAVSSNPYQAPSTVSGRFAVADTPPDIEDKMRRAWLAAVAGTIILPGIANVVSLFWLAQIAPYLHTLSARSRNRFYIAAVVNACGVLLALLLFLATLD